MADELPDLDPMMLLSDSARREIEAMGGVKVEATASTRTASTAGTSFHVEFASEDEAAILDTEVTAALEEPPPILATLNLSDVWDSPEQALERELRAHRAPLPEVEPDLARLFMSGEALDAEQVAASVDLGIGFEAGTTRDRPYVTSETYSGRAPPSEIVYPTSRSMTAATRTPPPAPEPLPGRTMWEQLEDD